MISKGKTNRRLEITGYYHLGSIEEKTHIEFACINMGKDLLVIIGGGETHIGSLAHTNKQDENSTYHCTYPGHRDDVIVEKTIEKLHEQIEGELLVVGGIHYDDISKEQIHKIIQNCDEILEKIKADLV